MPLQRLQPLERAGLRGARRTGVGRAGAGSLRQLAQTAARAPLDRRPSGRSPAERGAAALAPRDARGARTDEAPLSELEVRIQHAIRTDAQRGREVERVGPDRVLDAY